MSGARRGVFVVGWLALFAGIAAVVLSAVWVGNRALVAKDSLESAQAGITEFREVLGQEDAPSTSALYRDLSTDTRRAAEQTDDPVWDLYERLPVAGTNLVAFRQTTELVDALVQDGIGPLAEAADGVSVASLKPHDGGIDIEPLKRLTPAMGDIDDAIQAADASAANIDTTDVVPQLQEPVEKLRGMLHEAAPITAELRKVMPVLYPALGGEGTRHYLLMFQNNAEERASGGNPASMAMLVVKKGKIELGRQGDSGNFPSPYSVPPLDFKGQWDKIYSDYASTYVTNITMTPDFPTAARLAKTMWTGQFGGKVDGVISFDPVALSYLLDATGPVELADGKSIDSDNAVQYLLSDVYAKYADSDEQDAVFASAAQGVFKAVTNGQGEPNAYLKQLEPMMDEQRLKMWSTRDDEQELITDSPLGNMLPEDNSEKTVLGVYNNDDSTSKMSYFMDEEVKVQADTCRPEPRYIVEAKVINTLDPDDAYSLPQYVKAHQRFIDVGGDKQWVQLYGPVGAKLKSVTVDGEKVVWGTNLLPEFNTNYSATGAAWNRPAVKGNMYDRPVGVVNLIIGAGESKTVKAVFTGGDEPSETVEVSHTPKVREVPVEITRGDCG